MKICYLINGLHVSDDHEVVGIGPVAHNYYILQGNKLVAVPEELIVTKIYANAADQPPFLLDFIATTDIALDDQIDFSLVDRLRQIH